MDYSAKIIDVMINLFNFENLLYIALIILGGIIFIRIGDRILKKIEDRFDLNLTAHYLFKDLLKYTVIIIAVSWILHVLGINLESIIISLGVVGVAIGFASKDIVSNFISGIFIISDKKIQVGEVIEVNGFKGTIKKVGFRNTIMINQDNFEITIPNSVLSTNIYKIFKPTEDHRLRLNATLPYGMNIKQFKEDLDNVMFSYNWVLKDKTTIFAKEHNEWGPVVEVSYWIKEYKYIDCGKVTILENINKLTSEYETEKSENHRRKLMMNEKTNNKNQ